MKKFVDLTDGKDEYSTIYADPDDPIPAGEYKVYRDKSTGFVDIYKVSGSSYTVIDAAKDGVSGLVKWIVVVALSIVVLGLASGATFVTALAAETPLNHFLVSALMAGIGAAQILLLAVFGWGSLALPGATLVLFVLTFFVHSGAASAVITGILNVEMGIMVVFGAIPGLICLALADLIARLGDVGVLFAPILVGAAFGLICSLILRAALKRAGHVL